MSHWPGLAVVDLSTGKLPLLPYPPVFPAVSVAHTLRDAIAVTDGPPTPIAHTDDGVGYVAAGRQDWLSVSVWDGDTVLGAVYCCRVSKHSTVEKDDGSAYGVRFPDVPGCHSAADNLEDVAANAAEALALWFEDQPAIEPRDIEAVRAEVADDLGAGAFLIAVPLITLQQRQVRVNVSFDAGTLAAIDTAAEARKLTRSGFLAEAAQNEIVHRAR